MRSRSLGIALCGHQIAYWQPPPIGCSIGPARLQPDATACFKDYLDLNSISGLLGLLIRFDTLELNGTYGFCQSEKAGIYVAPTLDDLMSELEEQDYSAAQSSDDGVSDSELVFNLFIEGEIPESIAEESKDEPEVQVPYVTTEAEKAQESDESADGDFLSLAATGDADFYEKAVTDRLAALSRKYPDPECAYYPLIMQAKTTAKDWFTAEFAKRVGRYS